EGNAPIAPLALYQAGEALSAMLDDFPYGYLRLKALAGYIAQAGAELNLSRVLAPWHMLSLLRATYRISGMSDTRVDSLLDSLENELGRLWQGLANECAYDELFELAVLPSEQFGTLSPRLTPVGVEFSCSPESLIASLSGVIDNRSISAFAEVLGLNKDKESVLAFIKDYACRNPGCLYLVGNLMWLKPWGEPFTAVDVGRRSFGATALHEGWSVPFASEYADGIWRWVIPCELPAGIDAPKDVHYKFLIRIAHEGAEFDFYLPDASVAEKAGEDGNSLVRIGKSTEFQRLAQSNAPEAGRLTLQLNLDLYAPPEGMNHIQGLSLLAPALRGMGIRRIMLGPGTLFRGTLPYGSPYAPAALVSPYGETQDFVSLSRICQDLDIELVYDFVGGHTDTNFLPFPGQAYVSALYQGKIMPVYVWGSRRINDQHPDGALSLLWWLRALGIKTIRSDQAGTISSWFFMELKRQGFKVIAEWEDPKVQGPFEEIYFESLYHLMLKGENSFNELQDALRARLSVLQAGKRLLIIWNNHDKSSYFGGQGAFLGPQADPRRLQALFAAVSMLHLLNIKQTSLMLYYPDIFGYLGKICFMFGMHSPIDLNQDEGFAGFLRWFLPFIDTSSRSGVIEAVETGNPQVGGMLVTGKAAGKLMLVNLSSGKQKVGIQVRGEGREYEIEGYEVMMEEIPLPAEGSQDGGAMGKYQVLDAGFSQNSGKLLVRCIDVAAAQGEEQTVAIKSRRANPGFINGILEDIMAICNDPLVHRVVYWYTDEFVRSGDTLILEDETSGIYGVGTRTTVAVCERLKDLPVAWWHEMAHAYVAAHPQELACFEARLAGGRLRWVNSKDQRIRAHYILRAYQRQAFKEPDRYLSQQINGFHTALPAREPDEVLYLGDRRIDISMLFPLAEALEAALSRIADPCAQALAISGLAIDIGSYGRYVAQERMLDIVIRDNAGCEIAIIKLWPLKHADGISFEPHAVFLEKIEIKPVWMKGRRLCGPALYGALARVLIDLGFSTVYGHVDMGAEGFWRRMSWVPTGKRIYIPGRNPGYYTSFPQACPAIAYLHRGSLSKGLMQAQLQSAGMYQREDATRTCDGKQLSLLQELILHLISSVVYALSNGFTRWFYGFDHTSARMVSAALRYAGEVGLARLSEEIAAAGRIRAGPARLFAFLSFLGIRLFGFNFKGFIIINPSVISDGTETSKTIIHETAAISGRTHQECVALEEVLERYLAPVPALGRQTVVLTLPADARWQNLISALEEMYVHALEALKRYAASYRPVPADNPLSRQALEYLKSHRREMSFARHEKMKEFARAHLAHNERFLQNVLVDISFLWMVCSALSDHLEQMGVSELEAYLSEKEAAVLAVIEAVAIEQQVTPEAVKEGLFTSRDIYVKLEQMFTWSEYRHLVSPFRGEDEGEDDLLMLAIRRFYASARFFYGPAYRPFTAALKENISSLTTEAPDELSLEHPKLAWIEYRVPEYAALYPTAKILIVAYQLVSVEKIRSVLLAAGMN
ncbi:MAG: hypothetical protein WC547_07960, partial [Candidatus Omnitrophota bacterium]